MVATADIRENDVLIVIPKHRIITQELASTSNLG